MKRIFFTIVLIITISFNLFSKNLTISRDKTALKDGPANYYDNITILKSGAEVEYISDAKEDDGWVYVSYQKKKGDISKLAFSEKKKVKDPFDFDYDSGKKSKNDLSPASYTAAIKGFAIDYSKKKNLNIVNIDEILNILNFKAIDVIKVMNESKLAYFPKKGELIGVQNAFINAEMESLGLSASLNVLQSGIVFDVDMTKRVNIMANILNRQTYDYDKYYYVFIIKDSEPVAFCGPGGYIFISDILLKLLTDYREVVAVLAHETGHIALRHGYRDLAIDTARMSMNEAFDELAMETLTEKEMEISSMLEDVIDQALEAIKLVRDDKEEFEADDVAVELLRRYKINKKYLKDTLAKVYLKMGTKYPEYKTQFERRISRIK